MAFNIQQNKERAGNRKGDMEIFTNKIEIAGRIAEELQLSHAVFDEKFYTGVLEIERLSSRADSIPITLPESLVTEYGLKKDSFVKLEGQLRSYNYYLKVTDLAQNRKSRLVITAFCRGVMPFTEYSNSVMLDGYVCKPPVYRATPFGKHIADVLVAVNRNYGKSDYIPVIFWGECASQAAELTVGERITVEGRLQSRDYEKKTADGGSETRRTYEVSGFKLTKIMLEK